MTSEPRVCVRPYLGRPAGSKYALPFAVVCFAAAAVVGGFIWPRMLTPVAVSATAVVAIYLAFNKFRVHLCSVVAYFFFCGIIKKTLSDYGIVFFARDMLLALLYVSWLVRYPLRRGFRDRYDKFVLAALGAFVLYTLAVTLIPFTDELFIFRLGGARWWLALVPLFFVGADALDTPRRFDRFCWYFLALAGVTGLYGVLQYKFGFEHLYGLSSNFRASVEWGTWYGVDAPQNLRARVFSTFDLATMFAAMLRVACLLAVAYFVRVQKTPARLVMAALLAVCFAALLLTGTRAAYVPLVVALATYVALEPKRKKILPLLVPLALAFLLVMVLSSNVYLYRITLLVSDYRYTWDRTVWDWNRALTLVRDYPFGLGISTSAKGSKFVDPVFVSAGWQPTYRFIEHGFGQALVSLGWPGLISFAAMVAAVVGRLGVRLRTDRAVEWRLVMVFALCFSEIFPLLTHATLNFGVGPVMFWLLSGAVTSMFVRRGGTSAEQN